MGTLLTVTQYEGIEATIFEEDKANHTFLAGSLLPGEEVVFESDNGPVRADVPEVNGNTALGYYLSNGCLFLECRGPDCASRPMSWNSLQWDLEALSSTLNLSSSDIK